MTDSLWREPAAWTQVHPVPAVSLILRPQGEQQETNKDGQAFFRLDEDQSGNLGPSYLEAKLGSDTALPTQI